MSNWKDEMDRRCRRVMGVLDDSESVEIEVETNHYGTLTGDETVVTLRVGLHSRAFMDMGDLIRELDAVSDEADQP